MTALELREHVNRTLADQGVDAVTAVRIALEQLVDWLVEQEAEAERAFRTEG